MRKYSFNRSSRIAEQIQKDIVNILRLKVKDQRIEWVTINEVEVSSDCTLATIYWTTLTDGKRSDITKALESAKGFIRSELSHGFKTYTIPQLKFIYDDSMVRGAKILSLIDKVSQEFEHDQDTEKED